MLIVDLLYTINYNSTETYYLQVSINRFYSLPRSDYEHQTTSI